MSKRERPTDDDERPPKRARADFHPPQMEEIHFARQLQDSLVFRQDGIQTLRNGIASFKAFLESILYHREEDNRARQVSILREYLDTQKPSDAKDLERPFLAQLWQAWSFANQNNNDYLSSSVSAIFALLVKTLSGILDLRDYGVLLCRTVLQHQHLRLVKRCLDAPKHKEFLLSPALRLLTEVVGFDGGVVAQEVYKRREQTFDASTLRRNLAMVKIDMTEEEARRKPAIRTLTLRYVLALLKYLHEGAKIDILKNRPLCNALFHFIRDDPAELVVDLLVSVEQNILKDGELPRSSKAAILTSQNLERITDIAARNSEDHAAATKAHAWLKIVCTTSSYGILRQSGWYPPGTTEPDVLGKSNSIDLELDDVEHDTDGPINIRNSVLLSWALTLRANVSERERDLLLTCFFAAPELVAAYLQERKMQLDPKLSNTWIGYVSLMFEIVQLPVPPFFGHDGQWAQLPPRASIMIESILPRPLSQAVLTKCLNQSSDLITFFATRILVIAFEKLGLVLKQIAARKDENQDSYWKNAAERLLQVFTSRCPAMKDVITVFRKLPNDDEHLLQREATAKLLRLFYEVAPSQALEEQFDVSIALTTALTRSEKQESGSISDISPLRSLELEHLLAIAHHSPGMKWFTKQGSLQYSPLATLLRLHRKAPANRHLRSILQHVLSESGIVHKKSTPGVPSALDALVASLLDLTNDSSVWAFLDDCLSRANRKPVKYVDDLEEIAMALGKSQQEVTEPYPSILVAVLLEQAPFVVSDDSEDGKEKAAWTESFLDLLTETHDGGDVLRRSIKNLRKTAGWKRQSLKSRDTKSLLATVKLEDESNATDGDTHSPQTNDDNKQLPYQPPPKEPTSHPELHRWNQKELDLAIEEGDISALILCLCSEHVEVRKQAFTQLNKLKFTMRTASSHENSAQLALLIGELVETAEQQYESGTSQLPYLAGTFAVQALGVLVQPHHYMYPKLNRFLIRGPEWKVNRLPSHWLSSTALDLPEEDDAYWREVQWVLDWLVDGLRTTADLEILRRSSAFEKIFALWSSPAAGTHKLIRERILEIIFRATCVEGGGNTLVTRCGILSWFDVVANGEPKMNIAALRRRVLESCDAERLEAWSGGVKI